MPFQDFILIFRFRDQLAHGKTLRLTAHNIPVESPDGAVDLDEISDLQADWEQSCDIETATKWRDSVEQMSDRLCEATNCVSPIQVGYMSTWSGTLVRD